jgi:hypothetical protein
MRGHHRIVTLLALVLALVAGFASATAAAELVVALASHDGVPATHAPAPGASCAEALKALKSIGLKIIDVKGVGGLAFTLHREAVFGRPGAVAIVHCAPAEPEAEK